MGSDPRVDRPPHACGISTRWLSATIIEGMSPQAQPTETSEELAPSVDRIAMFDRWFLLGFFLPWPMGFAAVVLVVALVEPCLGRLGCTAESLAGGTAGYFLGWLLSAVFAWRRSSAAYRFRNLRATFLGAGVLPWFFMILGFLIFLTN